MATMAQGMATRSSRMLGIASRHHLESGNGAGEFFSAIRVGATAKACCALYEARADFLESKAAQFKLSREVTEQHTQRGRAAAPHPSSTAKPA